MDRPKIDRSKFYTTTTGLPVKIYEIHDQSGWPIHGAVLEDGSWTMCCWTIEGWISNKRIEEWDLIEARVRRFVARVPIEPDGTIRVPAGALGPDDKLETEYDCGFMLLYAVSDDSPASASSREG